ELGPARAPREEDREERGAQIVRDAENDPVGETVTVGVLAHTENSAIPRGDQRGHERGERERPAHEQILHRPAPCDPEEPHADVEEERRVCREERDVDGMERRPQNSALRLTKTFRVAAGKKYGTSSKVYPDVS